MTFGSEGDQSSDKGAWMCILVDDVDAVYQYCLAEGLEVTWPPTDMPCHLREMHVRHPDGHVFTYIRMPVERKPGHLFVQAFNCVGQLISFRPYHLLGCTGGLVEHHARPHFLVKEKP